MAVLVEAVGREGVPPIVMPDRFRHEVTYFMTPAGEPGVPVLGPGEFWIRAADARAALDDGVVLVVSPLGAENKAEIELSEEHESWLEWLVQHGIEQIRLRPSP